MARLILVRRTQMKENNSLIRRLVMSRFKYILIGALFTVVTVGIQVLTPWFMKRIVDEAIPEKEIGLLVFLITAISFLPFLSAALISFRNLFLHRIGGHVTDYLRRSLYTKLTRLSPKTYNDFKTGDISARIYSCGEIGDMYITQAVIPAILDVCLFIGIVIVMFNLNWELAVLSVGILPFLYLLSQFIAKKAKFLTGQVINLQQEMNIYSAEFVTGLKTVQMFNREESERNYLSDWIKSYRKTRNRAAIIDGLSKLTVDFGKALGLGLVFAYGAWKIFYGEITIGSLLAFTVYFPQLFGTLQSVQFAYIRWINIRPKIQLVEEILNLEDEVTDKVHKAPLKINGDIKFSNVSFSFQKGRGQVRDISFHIAKGEFIGIVGPSGGGKSTILDLLMRFYDPDCGEIRVDGVNVQEISLHDLRDQIGLVSQDVFLWNKSIKENLLYANPEATEKEMQEACQKAQVWDFIQSLPDKWDTVIGERGVKLSGGEKQRIGIARVLLRNPNVLLLDEPTSALDANTEALLQEQLELLFKNKTLIVVAHRLATIRNADRIFVVKDGAIEESGTHQELMEKRSIYHQLYTEQFQDLSEAPK
jgi:ABC-type multidrug transport system fused ATPase/permease subunit